MNDTLMLGGREFHSRFILGSGKYSLKLIEAAVRDAGAELITLAVRRANTREQENILDYIPKGVTLLPNTSRARKAEEAVRRLPEELRAVVILRYFAGYTQAETARALNIPQGTAATRQRRALQLLRLELGEEGDA